MKDNLGWVFPEGDYIKSMAGRLLDPATGQKRFRCGFDADPPTWHNRLVDYAPLEYELIYILKGTGTYEDETGYQNKVTGGCILQRFPNRRHTLTYQLKQEVITCYVTVTAELYEALKICDGLASPEPLIPYIIDKIIINKMKAIYYRLRDCSHLDIPRISGELYEFLIFTHRRIALAGRNPKDQELFEDACEIISENLDQKLLMPEAAKKLGMSYRSFRRLFETFLGKSPGLFRIEQRIERARDLLSCGYSIKTVVDRLNYPDVYTFAKQFKRITGLPPAQYKSQIIDHNLASELKMVNTV